jgi:fructose-1-phosphate kinase PfkB-like protein
MTPEFIAAVTKDPGLAPQERSQVLEWLKKPEVVKQLSGVAGAAIGVAVAKYMKLGRTSQFLLGIAGYGAGRLIYNYLKHKQEHRQFVTYDHQAGVYRMDPQR